MLKGVDISNWQKGINVKKLDVDFVICKATEGLNFVDKCCDSFIQQAKSANMLWGFYHFARTNNPEAEAEFFVKSCKGYLGHGIPVLDYEVSNSIGDAKWCELFITRFHDITQIWPMIYISACKCKDFTGSWIPKKCGLWLAGYPYKINDFGQHKMMYKCAPWDTVAIWQFTSRLSRDGWSIDGDYAYMSREAWYKYAGASTTQYHTGKSCYQLAQEVIDDKWGTGWNRKNALDSAYGPGTYDHVQAIVNDMIDN